MPITIGSNIASLRSLRAVADASERQNVTLERLSSGLRINRASDDAAGLAVASTLNAKSRVYGQAVKNINDGISLLNIAEGALSELTSIVDRQKELAAQAANGIYSGKQRKALSTEMDALVKEYNRILQSTDFNGNRLLSGSNGETTLQMGFGAAESLAIHVGAELGPRAGTGAFAAGVTLTGLGIFRSVASGDVNGDGIQDVVGWAIGSANVNLGNGDGTFRAAVGYPSSHTGNFGLEVQLHDLDGNGSLDIIGGADNGTFSVYLNNGNGTFKGALSYDAGFGSGANRSVSDLAVKDFNNDGLLDVVSASVFGAGTGGLMISYGRGGGTFSTGTTVLSGSNMAAVQSGDLDGDGHYDLVTYSSASFFVSILKGNGDGSFRAGASWAANSGALGAVAVADFDRDGDLDFTATGSSGSGVATYLNDGRGTFSPVATLLISASHGEASIGDLNGDGFFDLVVPTSYPHTARIAIGRGDGTFNAASSVPLVLEPSEVTINDFNGDGVLDFISGDFGGPWQFFAGVADPTGRTNPLMEDFDILSAPAARQTLDRLREYSERISREIGSIGATRSRLTSASNVLVSRQLGYRQAESLIKDADMAAETSALVRNSILQQTATAVLAQANLQPEIALRLLRS